MNTEEQTEGGISENTFTLIGTSHDNGDLVLSLKKDLGAKQVDAEFRVHRAFISLHSSVLRDLIESASPKEYVDGCPIIPCYGDSAEDFRALLTALYNGLAILQDDCLTLDVALAILRLSDKYHMEGLQRGVIRILFESWPLNYNDYATRQKHLGSPGFRALDSMKLIKSAQQCKAWQLLPTAFYEVAATRQQDWNDIELSASEEYLTQQDLVRMMKGRERAIKRLRPLVQWEGGSLIPPTAWNPDNSVVPISLLHQGKDMGLKGCVSRQRLYNGLYFCHNVSTALSTAVSTQLFGGASPLGLLTDLKRKDFEAAGVCASCVDWVFQCVLENKKMELWHNVTVDFELPRVDPKLYSERMLHTF